MLQSRQNNSYIQSRFSVESYILLNESRLRSNESPQSLHGWICMEFLMHASKWRSMGTPWRCKETVWRLHEDVMYEDSMETHGDSEDSVETPWRTILETLHRDPWRPMDIGGYPWIQTKSPSRTAERCSLVRWSVTAAVVVDVPEVLSSRSIRRRPEQQCSL